MSFIWRGFVRDNVPGGGLRSSGPQSGNRRRPGPKVGFRQDGHLVREIMLEHLSSRLPMTSPQLFDLVRGHYGEVCQRRLHRILARLVADGLVEREGDHRQARNGVPPTYRKRPMSKPSEEARP